MSYTVAMTTTVKMTREPWMEDFWKRVHANDNRHFDATGKAVVDAATEDCTIVADANAHRHLSEVTR